jgi:hypothetical protein
MRWSSSQGPTLTTWRGTFPIVSSGLRVHQNRRFEVHRRLDLRPAGTLPQRLQGIAVAGPSLFTAEFDQNRLLPSGTLERPWACLERQALPWGYEAGYVFRRGTVSLKFRHRTGEPCLRCQRALAFHPTTARACGAVRILTRAVDRRQGENLESAVESLPRPRQRVSEPLVHWCRLTADSGAVLGRR